MVRRLVALGVGLFLAVLTACSSDAGRGIGGTPSADADAAFPVTIEHKFGSTTIEAAPRRVLTIGFNEQDFALALGVEPVGVREFLGYDAPNRPWAPEAVRGKTIPTVGAEELDLEAVASLRPDLILGVNSYIDKPTYELLAKIAPTVAQTDEYPDGATPWDAQTELIGTALGKSAEAEKLITDTRAAFEQAASEHPEFAGKQAVFLLGSSPDGVWSVGLDDYRGGWLQELGFEVDEKSGQVSLEKLSTLDRDVLIGEGIQDEQLESDVFGNLEVVQQNRYIDLGDFDDDFAAALGFNSPLSIPFLLDIAVPRLAAATDGDPETEPEPYPGN
jgi:iron complex transport system substrate-binding protein